MYHNKAPGFNGIPNGVLKLGVNTTLVLFASFARRKGIFPTKELTKIGKKALGNSVSYTLICLYIMAKMMETVTHNRLLLIAAEARRSINMCVSVHSTLGTISIANNLTKAGLSFRGCCDTLRLNVKSEFSSAQ